MKELQMDDSPARQQRVSFADESVNEKLIQKIEELKNELDKSKDESKLILQELRRMDEEKYRQQASAPTNIIQNRSNRDSLFEIAELQSRLEKEKNC